MNDPKDNDRTSRKEGSTQGEKRSGRVSYDERGNSVWEWQLETGVYSKDVSTQKLKKLKLDDLSIAETAITKRPSGLGPNVSEKKTPGTGFNPYDNSSRSGSGFNPYDNSPRVGGGTSPYDTARALGDKFRDQPKTQAPRTLDDMRKLSEAIKKEKKDR